jgi:acetoin utilization deacetylase AcuC-like enzyme
VATGVSYDERCLRHDNGSMIVNDRVAGWLDVPHAEGAERLSRAWQVMERAGVLDSVEHVPARAATDDELLLVHTPEHLGTLRAAARGDGVVTIGPEARAGPGSWEAASVAVGGLLECVDRVMAGELANAYALCRPPGHHASADQAMGFCLFNAVAIAAAHLQARHGIERVAIVDWDVHHGNGTQDIARDDESLLFVSLHQWPLYPGTGGPDEQWQNIVNLPLPAGTGDPGYSAAWQTVEQAVFGFSPDLLLVSAGFDAHVDDPLSDMQLTADGFRALARGASQLAPRIAVVLEGGYNLRTLPDLVESALEGFEAVESS